MKGNAPPAQELVWSYPRLLRLEAANRHIRVVFAGETVADSRRALRVLETSHPPVSYLPLEDIKMDLFSRATGGRGW